MHDIEKSNLCTSQKQRDILRAAVSDQQMRLSHATQPRYPVDRYLVESSKKFEMVNIIDDDLWEPESALKPEDEVILRKLHEMLRSTADDLKLLSGELAKHHQDKVEKVVLKAQPTPLDDEFNEKVHIEELVNARFNGLKIVDGKDNPVKNVMKDFVEGLKAASNLKSNVDGTLNQENKKPVSKRLGITPTRIVRINENNSTNTKNAKNEILNNSKVKSKPSVVYNEMSYEYVKPKVETVFCNKLEVQHMPSINIRSELREQKVLQLDIVPETLDEKQNLISSQTNVAVIAAEHISITQPQSVASTEPKNYELHQTLNTRQGPVRKITKISTGDSSISSNNVSSDTKTTTRLKLTRTSPKTSARTKSKTNVHKKEPDRKIHFDVQEWKRKLNSVYAQPSSSKNTKSSSKIQIKKVRSKSNLVSDATGGLSRQLLNNAEYIPYSKLTLGGARVSDVEKEISDLTHKDIPLSPILDKILSSQENTPRSRNQKVDQNKIFTISDENLLEEVLDLEKVVSETLSVNQKEQNKTDEKSVENDSSRNSDDDNKDSYADDFEDEKSEDTESSDRKTKSSSQSQKKSSKSAINKPIVNSEPKTSKNTQTKTLNKTYTKVPSLAIKKSVDIFEFVHSVDTQDTATQSNATNKISLKETQTSPKSDHDQSNIQQPIHNELWPSIDPKGEVEKMFQLEKDFIKKVILDEYGDLIAKNLSKPSTSQENKNFESNVKVIQKNTQTSPAHIKCVMTSPIRTKTRTTSPYISLKVDKVDKTTSPVVVVTNEEELTVEVDINNDDNISVNLSSPRFSLRLPNTSREVLSNLDVASNRSAKNNDEKHKSYRKGTVCSSSSTDRDYSSSDLSSLGEVKLRKLLKKHRMLKLSNSSSESKYSSDGGILPLKSEGEITSSLGQTQTSRKNKNSKSEGEMSLRTK